MTRHGTLILGIGLGAVAWLLAAPAAALDADGRQAAIPPSDDDALGHAEGDTTIAFEDVTRRAGLAEPLDCMMGHAAAAGDVDGDGFPELFFGTFADRPAESYGCSDGPRPDRLLWNRGDGTWRPAEQPALEQHARTSGAAFADLDNDGDLDLVVTRNPRDGDDPIKARTNALYRNDGGSLVDVSAASHLRVPGMKARNVIPLDYDGDRRLDLLIVEDLLGSIGSRLFHNEGDLRFQDRTAAAGLPTDLGGLGAAVGDVDNDGWPDLFIAHEDVLFVNDGAGHFGHARHLDQVFRWPGEAGSEDWRAGAAFGDVNRDGRLDLVVSHHYDSAYATPRSVRLYLNRSDGRQVLFEDVTAAAGLAAIPAKAPHVEMQDLDNDGWLDIVVSVRALLGGTIAPLVFRHAGGGSTPRFETPSFTVPYQRDTMLGYWPAAPTLDFDRDGRLDLFGVEWDPHQDSALYRNRSRSGNYLEVAIDGLAGTNAMGIGARIEIYEPGQLGNPAALIGRGELATGYGYSSGQEAVAHFGLADRRQVDMRIVLPHGGAVHERRSIDANQRLVLSASS